MLTTYARLAEAYIAEGFAARLDEPFCFIYGDGDVMSFHSPVECDMVVVRHVIEDIAAWNPCLAERMKYRLGNGTVS